MRTIRIATLAAVLAGALVGLAATASAEPLDGPYVATVTGGNVLTIGKTMPWMFQPCGQDCARRILIGGDDVEFHLQGNTWTSHYGSTTEAIDASSLSAVSNQPDGSINWQLSRPS